MRVAALCDIHGNLPALEAVLHEVRRERVDLIVVGGDVFPGPMSAEALAALLACELPVRFVRGNGDREMLALARGETSSVPEAYRAGMEWEARRLTPDQVRELASWPATVELDIDGVGATLFCHATPASDTPVFTRRTPEDRLRPVFEGLAARVVVVGHTHMPFDRRVNDVRVMNPGSVGMPYGPPGAYWLRLGPDVQPRRTDYDLQAAAARIRVTGHPGAEDFAARNVIEPLSEEEVLERFAPLEIR